MTLSTRHTYLRKKKKPQQKQQQKTKTTKTPHPLQKKKKKKPTKNTPTTHTNPNLIDTSHRNSRWLKNVRQNVLVSGTQHYLLHARKTETTTLTYVVGHLSHCKAACDLTSHRSANMTSINCSSVNPLWTHLPQITQLCALCCLEETTAQQVYCDSFLPTTAVTMQFLLLPGQKNYKVQIRNKRL